MRRLRYSVAATRYRFIADPDGGPDLIIMDEVAKSGIVMPSYSIPRGE